MPSINGPFEVPLWSSFWIWKGYFDSQLSQQPKSFYEILGLKNLDFRLPKIYYPLKDLKESRKVWGASLSLLTRFFIVLLYPEVEWKDLNIILARGMTISILLFSKWMGLPIEWGLLSYFSFPMLFKYFGFDTDQLAHVYSLIIITSMISWCLLPSIVLSVIATLASTLFVLNEYKASRLQYVLGLAISLIFCRFSANGFSLVLAAHLTALTFLFSLYSAWQFFLYHFDKIFNYLGFEIPAPPVVSLLLVNQNLIKIKWLPPKSIKKYEYRIELNGFFIGQTTEREIQLKDLKPSSTYRIRIFAVQGFIWTPSLPLHVRTWHPCMIQKTTEIGVENKQTTTIQQDKELEALEAEYQQCKQQREQLEQQLKETQTTYTNELKEINDQIQKYQEQLKQMESNSDRLAQKQKVKSLEEQRKDLEQKIKEKQKIMTNIEKQITSVNQSIEQKKESIEAGEEDCQRLMQESKEEEEKFNLEKAQMTEDIQRLESINKELEIAIEKKGSELCRVQEQLDQKQMELTKYKNEFSILESKYQMTIKMKETRQHTCQLKQEELNFIINEKLVLQESIETAKQRQLKISNDMLQLQTRQPYAKPIADFDHSLVSTNREFYEDSDTSIDELLDAVTTDRLLNQEQLIHDEMGSIFSLKNFQQKSVKKNQLASDDYYSFLNQYSHRQFSSGSSTSNKRSDTKDKNLNFGWSLGSKGSKLRPEAPEYQPFSTK